MPSFIQNLNVFKAILCHVDAKSKWFLLSSCQIQEVSRHIHITTENLLNSQIYKLCSRLLHCQLLCIKNVLYKRYSRLRIIGGSLKSEITKLVQNVFAFSV